MQKVYIILRDIFHKIEEIVLFIVLSIMIIFSFLQIIMRIEWFSRVVQYSVLWVGFIGAGMATFRNKHIKIDIIGRMTKGRTKSIVLTVTNLFGFAVSLLLAVISYIYIVKIEIPAGDPPPFLNIPKWSLLTIIPIGFVIISIRFLFRSIMKLINAVKNVADDDEEV